MRSYLPVNLAYIWIVCFFTIFIVTITWWILAPVALTIIDSITNNFNLGSPWDSLITIMKNVLYWFPLLLIFGVIIWAYNASKKPQVVTYPYEY